MNSGWTKVAAFASAHLESVPGRHPQVIFDSRVATAILSRLDSLLAKAGFSSVPQSWRIWGLLAVEEEHALGSFR